MQKILLISTSSLAFFAAGMASAQTTSISGPTSVAASSNTAAKRTSTGSVEVPEVIVTSTRRSENLQKVTGTVEAVGAATLKTLGVTSVVQLGDLVPGLLIVPTGGNNIFIRGIGTVGGGYNEAQSAVYIDGVYMTNPSMGLYSFNNIDRVEVLKGPQGTLYGRNVTAGLVSITTRDPAKAPVIDASIGYGNYNTSTENFYGSMPLTGDLAMNVAVYNTYQGQGWGRNVFTGHENTKNKETGVETKLLWDPTSSTKATTTFIYDTNNRDNASYEILPGTIANDGSTYLGKYKNASRIDQRAPFTAYIASEKIQQDVGFANLMSLTAYQNSRQHIVYQANGGQLGQPLPGQGTVIADFHESNLSWSQEFQLTSKPSNSPLTWVGGLFYYHDITQLGLSTSTTCVGNVCAPGFIPNTVVGRLLTESYSGYGDATYRVFDATHLTVGLRYTDETKGLAGRQTPLPGFPNSVATLPATFVTSPGQPFPGSPSGIPTSLHFDKLTYRIVLAQDFGPNIHAYVSDNLGFKSGQFNGTVFTNPPVQPEELNAYEAGVKSELFDRKLRVNLAYFYYDYDHVQLRSTAPPAPPGTAILENVASEREQGVDADFSFVPIRGLTINGGFEVLDAKYVKFPGSSCSRVGPTTVQSGVLVGSIITVPCDLSGRRVANAAPFSGSLGFVYNFETSTGVFSLAGNYHYEQRHSMVPDGAIYAPAANLVDASLTWTSLQKHYDVQVYVRNLTNDFTYASAAEAAGDFAFAPGPPRVFGITVGYHY